MTQARKYFLIKVGARIGVALRVRFYHAVLLGGPGDDVVPGLPGLGDQGRSSPSFFLRRGLRAFVIQPSVCSDRGPS